MLIHQKPIKMENKITFKFNNKASSLEEGLNVSVQQFDDLKAKLLVIDQTVIADITKDSSISLIKIVETVYNSGLTKEELVLAFSMITFSELKEQYQQKLNFNDIEEFMDSQEDDNEEIDDTYEEIKD
jgi:hypothetical protein